MIAAVSPKRPQPRSQAYATRGSRCLNRSASMAWPAMRRASTPPAARTTPPSPWCNGCDSAARPRCASLEGRRAVNGRRLLRAYATGAPESSRADSGSAGFGSGRAVRFVAVRRRARFRSALGDRDQRRPQHAIADHVAGLHDLDHGARRYRRVRDLIHRLLKVRVEFLARWIEFLDAVFLQRVEQRPLGQFDAFDQRLQAGIG